MRLEFGNAYGSLEDSPRFPVESVEDDSVEMDGIAAYGGGGASSSLSFSMAMVVGVKVVLCTLLQNGEVLRRQPLRGSL